VQLGDALTRKNVQIMRASAASGSGSPGGHAGTMRTVSGGNRGRTMPSPPCVPPASVPDVYLRVHKLVKNYYIIFIYMLSPKRTKFRKYQKGSIGGIKSNVVSLVDEQIGTKGRRYFPLTFTTFLTHTVSVLQRERGAVTLRRATMSVVRKAGLTAYLACRIRPCVPTLETTHSTGL